MKKDNTLENLKTNKKSYVPYSEICDAEENKPIQNGRYFDGDVEVLMGEDINLKNAKVEKVFVF